MRWKLATVLIMACVVMVLGCGLKHRPYGFSVQQIDELGPPEEAMIRLSKPQVLTRAALLNDRLREAEHLESMLAASRSLTFGAQSI